MSVKNPRKIFLFAKKTRFDICRFYDDFCLFHFVDFCQNDGYNVHCKNKILTPPLTQGVDPDK